jgi:hypothetical protein
MKTALIIVAVLLLNASALFVEVLPAFLKEINPFLLLGIDFFLLLGYFGTRWFRDLIKAYSIDFGYPYVFVVEL